MKKYLTKKGFSYSYSLKITLISTCVCISVTSACNHTSKMNTSIVEKTSQKACSCA